MPGPSHVWLFTYKLNKLRIILLTHPRHISNIQLPQVGLVATLLNHHRYRTLTSQKSPLDIIAQYGILLFTLNYPHLPLLLELAN